MTTGASVRQTMTSVAVNGPIQPTWDRVVCLVDLFNVQAKLHSLTDVELAVEEAVQALISAARAQSIQGAEFDLRLYGGWMDPTSSYTHVANWLLQAASNTRGLRGGWRIVPTCVTTLARFPSVILNGTLRKAGGRPQQKMVDTMLCLDLLYFIENQEKVLLLSDDDDLMPAVLTAASMRPKELSLIRRRAAGQGMNDHCLAAHSYQVQVVTY